MEQTNNQPPQDTAEHQQQEEVKEPYHDLGEYVADLTKLNVETKPVSAGSYGHRLRIAKLYESHEEFMYKIITVAGWARTVRPGGKDFVFIELTDGSCQKGLQVVVFGAIEGFDNISKTNVGTSFRLKGTLIKSPAKGQLFELQLS